MKRYLFIVLLCLLVACNGTTIDTSDDIPDVSDPVACTMDAKICPDGSAVGRVGPNCEFAPCPSSETSLQGIVFGTAGMYQGNCMPGPDREPCTPRKVQTTVYITEPSELYEQDLLVASTETDEQGYFELALAPGTYSLFLYDNLPGWEDSNSCGQGDPGTVKCDAGGAFNCDRWTCEEGDCFCTPFTVTAGERTEVHATIDHAAW